MLLTSIEFLIFSFITVLLFFIVSKKFQWIILLISSCIFLFYNNLSINTVIQALIVLITSYVCGILIDKYKNSVKSKFFLCLGIFIIIVQIFLLKYFESIILAISSIFKNNILQLHSKKSLIGISYYSFIMISYLIDIYRGICKSQKNIFKLALFMSYFPILTSGPFVRYNSIEKDLFGKHKFNYNFMCRGLVRIFWGLFKILVISERLSFFVDKVYLNLHMYNGFFTIIAILFFPLQLYTNFSGSIDIIMGISEIMGINLPENFKMPFFSKTMTEFWRNWHITLGAWLRDYILYPIQKSNGIQNLNQKCKKIFGRKIAKKITLYICLLIGWTFMGIWHGGAIHFIIGSGLLQCVYMILEDILKPISDRINKKLNINTEVFSYKLYQVIRTYLLFSFSMIFFKAKSVNDAIKIIKSAFVWNPWILFDNKSLFNVTEKLNSQQFSVLAFSILILFIVEFLSLKLDVREKLFNQNIIFRWGIIYCLILIVVIFGCWGLEYDATQFIYEQF